MCAVRSGSGRREIARGRGEAAEAESTTRNQGYDESELCECSPLHRPWF